MKIAIAAAELAVPQQWISLEKYAALNLELVQPLVYKCLILLDLKEGYYLT